MDLLTKPPSTLPGNAQQEPGQGVVFKSNTMYAGLNDDHDDPCFMCRGNCKNCDFNVCSRCGELAEECICHEYRTNLFEELTEILRPEPIILK